MIKSIITGVFLIFLSSTIENASGLAFCTAYYMGQSNRTAVCPNFCCGRCDYRYCCSYISESFNSDVTTCNTGLSFWAIFGIVFGSFILLIVIAIIVTFIVRTCCPSDDKDGVVQTPPPADMPVIYTTTVVPPPQPPMYFGQPGYSAYPPPAGGPIIVNLPSGPSSQPAPAGPSYMPMPVPVFIPGPYYGGGHCHGHGGVDAPLATGYRSADAPL